MLSKFCHNKKGAFLHAHHIIQVSECLSSGNIEKIYDVNNGITYCKDHHLKTGLHRKDKKFK